MAWMHVSAERTVDAPAETVYRYIADMRTDELGRLDAYAREHRPS